PGHWLEDKMQYHLRDDFIAIDITNDGKLPLRIVEALGGIEIDGIVTFTHSLVVAAAKAAEILNLLTQPASAYIQAHDKYKARKLLNHNIQILRLDDVQHLDYYDKIGRLESLQYPLVVKPCQGSGSRGVKRVNDGSSLRQAVQELENDEISKNGILIETYIDGPEVDANFVLWEGEIYFFEIADSLPCSADATDATISNTFLQTAMVLPSQLDPEEREMIRSSMHKSLLQLGFRTGIFHVEARMRNSSMNYSKINGLLDLVNTESAVNNRPDVILIEVNARPPGLHCIFATAHTYGVDYYGLHLLLALNDKERVMSLSKFFTCRAQYWCEIIYIPIYRDRMFVPENFCKEVIQYLSTTASRVSKADCFGAGKTLSPVRGLGLIAYFLLYSRISRRDVLEMGERVQEISKRLL
ncbi:hypothetical protein F5884DRAFT_647942, partial [Xylogone sp. PMI_703]